MDTAIFVPNQTQVILRGVGSSPEDVPSTIGPATFDLANTVGGSLPGGVIWLVGKSEYDSFYNAFDDSDSDRPQSPGSHEPKYCKCRIGSRDVLGIVPGRLPFGKRECTTLVRWSQLTIPKEPDLYTAHGNRPGLSNYSTQDYFNEFGEVISDLHNTTFGDLLKSELGPMLGGPTICCQWVGSNKCKSQL
jgi:hypothetical protein